MDKRVLLIHPLRQDYWFSDTPHVGLAQLAAVLRDAGHEVRVIDFVLWGKQHPSTADVVEIAREFGPDVIGVSMYTSVESKAFELIDALRPLDVPVMAGGPHCSLNYDALRLDDRLDYVFKGEAEPTIVEVVETATKHEFPKIIETRVFDQNALPHPDFSLFVNHEEMTAYPLITSRGCQFQCNFCVVSHVTNKQWRPRDVDLIIDECATNLGATSHFPKVASVVVSDDNPMSDRRRYKDFLRRYAVLELDKLLSIANIRADTLDPEMLQALKAANCQAVCLGVESGDPVVFKQVNKGETLEQIRDAAGMIKDAGLSLGMCFVIGLPHDTWDRHRNSVAFAKEFGTDYVYWNVMHPMKGTDAHYYFKQRGMTIDDDADYTSLSDLTWETNEPLVETPEFSKWERKKARYYAVVETDQYIPYPHLLGQFVARAREYDLIDTAVDSLARMRVKHPELASHLDRALAELRQQPDEGTAVASPVATIAATPNDGGSAPIGPWLADRLFDRPREPQNLLERFVQMYPQLPGLALWRAIEGAALSDVEFPAPILDLGCGDGTFTEAVLPGRRIACGLDIESVNFPKARSLGIYDRLTTYDGETMPFDDDAFGAILVNSVLEHVENLDLVLHECARVLRPGGSLVLTVPVQAYDELLYFAQLARADGDETGAADHVAYHRTTSHHVNWWTPDEWAQRLRGIGFEIGSSRGYLRQTSAWLFDILKTLEDQRALTAEAADDVQAFQARFNRLLLERVMLEAVESEARAEGPAAGLLIEALAPAAGADQTPDAAREPVIDATIYDNPAPFSKPAGDPATYAQIQSALTRDGLEHVSCYMCGADEPRPVGRKEGLEVVECGRCGFFYVNPRMPADKLAELYDRSYWYQRMQLHGYPNIVDRAGHDYRLAVARWEALAERKPTGRYLDVGCSNGAMVRRADELGYEAYGLELDADIAALARDATGRPIFEGPLGSHHFEDGHFDVISILDVFEHLYDPRTELKELKRVLADDGLLVIETFRRDCPQFEAGLPDISHDDIKPGEHIYMYRQHETRRLLAEAGLDVRAEGFPDGPANSRLLLHVGHAAAAGPTNGRDATKRAKRRKGGKRGRRRSKRSEPTTVSVIIPTHNRADALAETLGAYASQSRLPHEVIVVDDGSTDRTPDVARAVEGVPIVYHRQENAGPATARNWALARASGDLILISGDDVVPDSDLIDRHVAAHADRPEPNVAVIGRIGWSEDAPVSYFMNYITGIGGQQFNYAELERLDAENLPAGWFLTSNISLKRAWLASTGERFDERFPHAAYEDIEFGMRLQKSHGLRIAFAPDAIGRHLHPQSYEDFCRRQYKAGRSAAMLIDIHPELADQFTSGDPRARLAEQEATLAEHDRAIQGFEIRLDSGSSLSDVERVLLNAHYKAALDAHHLRGLVDGIDEIRGPASEVTVAIISLNHRDRLHACIESIRAHTPRPDRLLVVDAGSNEGEPVALGDGVEVIGEPAQRSRAWAFNAAIEATAGDLVLVDAGVTVSDGWLDALLAGLHAQTDVGVIGPMANYAPLDQLRRPGAGPPGEVAADDPPDVLQLGGFCLALSRPLIDAVGGFDERFVHEGQFGEVDLILRARQAGFRAVVARDSFVTWEGERRGLGAGPKHRQVVSENWARLCRKWDVRGDPTPGDPASISAIADRLDAERRGADGPVIFVAAPNWSDPASGWRDLIRHYTGAFEPDGSVELRMLIDPAAGFDLEAVVAEVRDTVAGLPIDPERAPALELVDEFEWADGAPDQFRAAHVFVATEPELERMRSEHTRGAERAGLPVIRKAEPGAIFRDAARAAGLLIAADTSAESLQAARLLASTRPQPVGVAT